MKTKLETKRVLTEGLFSSGSTTILVLPTALTPDEDALYRAMRAAADELGGLTSASATPLVFTAPTLADGERLVVDVDATFSVVAPDPVPADEIDAEA